MVQVVFLFQSRKSPIFFHGTTPEVNYLQSGSPPVSVTICQNNALLPEPPLKGPLVEDQPSSEVEEEARKKGRRKKIAWHPIHSDFQLGRLIVVDTPSSQADGRYRVHPPTTHNSSPLYFPPGVQLRLHICSLYHLNCRILPAKPSLSQSE